MGPAVPYMDAKTAERVAKLGEVAHRHLEFLETHGQSMTRADSLAIRREMYGEKVRNTANLFGERDSGALFQRELPYGTAVKDGDPIRLTDVNIDGVAEEFGGETAGRSHRGARAGRCLTTLRVSAVG